MFRGNANWEINIGNLWFIVIVRVIFGTITFGEPIENNGGYLTEGSPMFPYKDLPNQPSISSLLFQDILPLHHHDIYSQKYQENIPEKHQNPKFPQQNKYNTYAGHRYDAPQPYNSKKLQIRDSYLPVPQIEHFLSYIPQDRSSKDFPPHLALDLTPPSPPPPTEKLPQFHVPTQDTGIFSSPSFLKSYIKENPYDDDKLTVHRHISVHEIKKEDKDSQPQVIQLHGKQEKHVNIIFVKAPVEKPPQTEIVLPAEPKQKTIVYVLVKKPDIGSTFSVKESPYKKPPKPEVYFIRYKDEKLKEYGVPN